MKKTLIALLALGGVAIANTITYNIAQFVDFKAGDVTANTKTAKVYTLDYGVTVTASADKSWNTEFTTWDDDKSKANYTGLNTLTGTKIESGALDYISAGDNSTLTLTISGLTAGNSYTIGFITGGAENVQGAWNTVSSTNTTTSVEWIGNTNITSWNVAGVQRNQPTGILAKGVVANDEGKIILTTTSTSGHHATANALSITGTLVVPSPSVPEPTTATLSLVALAGLAARRRRR